MNHSTDTQTVPEVTPGAVGSAACRLCGALLPAPFLDLGAQPPCESFLQAAQLREMERFYPLDVYVCPDCHLVQLEEYVGPAEIFTEYAYFSSFSDSWLRHAKNYVAMVVDRFRLGSDAFVAELASNDGYLLQYFADYGVPVLGIEPAVNVARRAVERGVPTLVQFFGVNTAEKLAREGKQADLVIGNNVLAQVPDLHDFVEGMRILLNADGVITMEFPHILQLLQHNQFDTIYHEHFSYFSLASVERLFAQHGLRLFDVEELATHGGSLRVFGCLTSAHWSETARLGELRLREESIGLGGDELYSAFAERVRETKRKLLELLIEAKRQGKHVVGYGAPGKGNTLLNYCGIRTDFLDYVVDRNPYKQGRFLPGTHIPIYHPDKIRETRPDFVLILPWNLKEEIIAQMSWIREWGGRFIVPIPEPEICS